MGARLEGRPLQKAERRWWVDSQRTKKTAMRVENAPDASSSHAIAAVPLSADGDLLLLADPSIVDGVALHCRRL